jgi:hypothetical protein
VLIAISPSLDHATECQPATGAGDQEREPPRHAVPDRPSGSGLVTGEASNDISYVGQFLLVLQLLLVGYLAYHRGSELPAVFS